MRQGREGLDLQPLLAAVVPKLSLLEVGMNLPYAAHEPLSSPRTSICTTSGLSRPRNALQNELVLGQAQLSSSSLRCRRVKFATPSALAFPKAFAVSKASQVWSRSLRFRSGLCTASLLPGKWIKSKST